MADTICSSRFNGTHSPWRIHLALCSIARIHHGKFSLALGSMDSIHQGKSFWLFVSAITCCMRCSSERRCSASAASASCNNTDPDDSLMRMYAGANKQHTFAGATCMSWHKLHIHLCNAQLHRAKFWLGTEQSCVWLHACGISQWLTLMWMSHRLFWLQHQAKVCWILLYKPFLHHSNTDTQRCANIYRSKITHSKSHLVMCIYIYTLCTPLPVSALVWCKEGMNKEQQTAQLGVVCLKPLKWEKCDQSPAAAWFPDHAVPAEHLPPAAACPNSAQCIQQLRLYISMQHICTMTACVSLLLHNKCSKRSLIYIWNAPYMHQCQTRQGLKLLRQDNMEFWFGCCWLLIPLWLPFLWI